MPQNNVTATRAPTSSDDGGKGYSIGSLWAVPHQRALWICVDHAIGAARWAPTVLVSVVSDGAYSQAAHDLGIGDYGPAVLVGSDCQVDLFSATAQSLEGESILSPRNSGVLKVAGGWSFLRIGHVYNGPGGVGVASLASAGALHAHVGIIHCAHDSIGCGGGISQLFGHLHIYAGDIYFLGNGGIGVIAGSNVGAAINVVGHIEHMLNAGGDWTGTVGFAALDEGETVGRINMTAGYVIAETLAVVGDNSFLRVVLADGRVLGTSAAGPIGGTEQVVLTRADGTTVHVALSDLKTWVNS